MNTIAVTVKKECVRLFEEGYTWREIYNEYYSRHYNTSYKGFRCMAQKWHRKTFADDELLDSANLKYDFVPHDSTVQINGKGEIVQAWIKQSKAEEEEQFERLVEHFKTNQEPIIIEPTTGACQSKMLEIPLADMHFGNSDLEYYMQTLKDIVQIIHNYNYDEINIVYGQDALHNDNFNGTTTKGTQIEKVDMVKAWDDALTFFGTIITNSLKCANKVNLYYSCGNHDYNFSWAFVQLLKAKYPQLNVDDALLPRKAFLWRGCFIGFSHAEYKKSSVNDLFQQFVCEFPEMFAKSTIREVHTGHLHSESVTDKGITIRRLPTGNKTDEWTRKEGFVGSHKRFQLFEYEPNKLKAIYYV